MSVTCKQVQFFQDWESLAVVSKFYLFSILSKFFCIFLTFLTLRLEFKAILVIFLVLLTFLVEKLKIRDRKILIFWQSLFIFSWKMSFMLFNCSQMAPIWKIHENNKEYLLQALQREKNRDRYRQKDAERKRYQHLLTKLVQKKPLLFP